MFHRRQHLHSRGMTLIEIMVVITILGLISGAVGLAVMDNLRDARRERVGMDFDTLRQGLELYRVKTGRYPDTAAGLGTLVDQRVLPRLPVDPWRNPYAYVLEGSEPVLISYGADGMPGGSGDDADITSINGTK